MRKSFHLFFVLFLVFAWCGSILAQEPNQFGIAPNMGQVKQPQYESGNNPLANTGYGNDAIGSGFPFLSFPIPAGTPFNILNANFTPGWLAGADMDAAGAFYGCAYIGAGTSNLVQVDVMLFVAVRQTPAGVKPRSTNRGARSGYSSVCSLAKSMNLLNVKAPAITSLLLNSFVHAHKA